MILNSEARSPENGGRAFCFGDVMKFQATKDVLLGVFFYRAGEIYNSPTVIHPTFEPLDDEAKTALEALGVKKEVKPVPEEPKAEEEKSDVLTSKSAAKSGGKCGRPRRQPY